MINAVAANTHARRQQAALEARQEASAELEKMRTRRADTTTPLAGAMMPTEQLPDPPALFEDAPAVEEQPGKAARVITLRACVDYRGRRIEIHATGMTLDSFCDMLDKRLGKAAT